MKAICFQTLTASSSSSSSSSPSATRSFRHPGCRTSFLWASPFRRWMFVGRLFGTFIGQWSNDLLGHWPITLWRQAVFLKEEHLNCRLLHILSVPNWRSRRTKRRKHALPAERRIVACYKMAGHMFTAGAERQSTGLTFTRRIKSHLPFAGIIRGSPYSPR